MARPCCNWLLRFPLPLLLLAAVALASSGDDPPMPDDGARTLPPVPPSPVGDHMPDDGKRLPPPPPPVGEHMPNDYVPPPTPPSPPPVGEHMPDDGVRRRVPEGITIGGLGNYMPNDNAPLLAAESESAPDVPMPGDDPEAREPHGSHDEHMPGNDRMPPGEVHMPGADEHMPSTAHMPGAGDFVAPSDHMPGADDFVPKPPPLPLLDEEYMELADCKQVHFHRVPPKVTNAAGPETTSLQINCEGDGVSLAAVLKRVGNRLSFPAGRLEFEGMAAGSHAAVGSDEELAAVPDGSVLSVFESVASMHEEVRR